MSSSKERIRQVPPPPGGGKGARLRAFHPREELLVRGLDRARCPVTEAPVRRPADAQPQPRRGMQPSAAARARQAATRTATATAWCAGSFKQSFARRRRRRSARCCRASSQIDALEQAMAQRVAAAVMLARQVVRSELRPARSRWPVAPEAQRGCCRRATSRVRCTRRPALVAQGAEERCRRAARRLPRSRARRGGCLVESDLGIIDARIERAGAGCRGVGSERREQPEGRMIEHATDPRWRPGALAALSRLPARSAGPQPLPLEPWARWCASWPACSKRRHARAGRLGLRSAGDSGPPVQAEVVGFDGDRAFLMPTGEVHGLASGARVLPRPSPATPPRLGAENHPWRRSEDRGLHLPVGDGLLGRVVDPHGQPMDRQGPIDNVRSAPMIRRPINAMDRDPVRPPLDTGVRAINAMLTVGRGQRIGLFAGTGVGKSVLLGMMARYTEADVIVVGLIGERGREVKEFIEDILGPVGLQRSIVVAAPADSAPLVRMQGATYATAIAEHYRDRGQHVLLLMDSLTRYAMAQREIALAIGEPPATKGYPPSCFAKLPQLVERSGNGCRRG
jgi:hypothetical protein